MYQRILVALDGSATSDLALEEAIRLAREQNATLRLAHVIDDLLGLATLKTPHQMADYQAELHKTGAHLLAAAAAEAREGGIEAETALLWVDGAAAHIYEAVEREAERWQADLIVIGTHGRRGFRRLLLGSVAEGLVRVATKPVLLIRQS